MGVNAWAVEAAVSDMNPELVLTQYSACSLCLKFCPQILSFIDDIL